MDKLFPSVQDSFSDELLPTFWTAKAEEASKQSNLK